MAKSTCSVDACETVTVARGFCDRHYRKFRRYGDPLAGPGKGQDGADLLARTCSVDGCERHVRNRTLGVCRGHGQIYANYGTLDPVASATARFMSFVAKTGDGCWRWTGSRSGSALEYGQFSWRIMGRPMMGAHRAAWELFRGPVPDGLTLDHLCRNTLCVNPTHLEPVTQAENNRRMREAKASA